MDYKITVPTQAQIQLTLNHKESIAILRMIGKTSQADRRGMGMQEEDARICSDIFFGIALDDKYTIGL